MMNERDRLVEQYMDGKMSPSEEREFLRRTESDADLRNLLEAERAIVSGTGKERGAMYMGPMEPNAALLAKLSATPAVMAAGGSAGTGGWMILGHSIVRWALAAVGALGIIIGAFILAPMLAPEQAEQEATPEVIAPAPRIDRPSTTATPQQQRQAEEAPSQPRQEVLPSTEDTRQSSSNRVRQSTGDEANKPALSRTAPKEPSETKSVEMRSTERKSTETNSAFPLDEGGDDRTVIDNDTVRVRTNLGGEKKK